MQQLCLFDFLKASAPIPLELLGPRLVKIMAICPDCRKPSKRVEVEAELKARLEARNRTIKKTCAACKRTQERGVQL